jgi:hypothetical protein
LERTEARVVQKEGTRNLRTSHVQGDAGKVYTSGKAKLVLFACSFLGHKFQENRF